MWGDAHVNDATVVLKRAPQESIVVANSHTYSTAGTYTIKVTVHSVCTTPTNTVRYSRSVTIPAYVAYDLRRSYAEGPGLSSANTAEPATFTINAADTNGNPVVPAENPFTVTILQPTTNSFASPAVSANVLDNRNGTYTVTYQPNLAGPHEITVGLRFRLITTIGTDATKSLVSGLAVSSTIPVFVGVSTSLNIQAIGTDGGAITHGGDRFQVKVTGPTSEDVFVGLKDFLNGTYRAVFVPSFPGQYKIEVTLKETKLTLGSPVTEGTPVASSPYTISVCCAGGCTDMSTDNHHCGSCDVDCLDSASCCSSVCVNTASDTANCGSCGHVCGPGQLCIAGKCQTQSQGTTTGGGGSDR